MGNTQATPTSANNGPLIALSSYRDGASGVAEEFLPERLGAEGAFALLSTPVGRESSDAWLLCPAIGPEHGSLRRLEAIVARALAQAGVPTLRIRPDVGPSGAMGTIDLAARRAEVADAVALLRHGGSRIAGALGITSGTLLAGLACEQYGLPGLVAVDPIRRGGQYLRETLRRQAVTDLMTSPEQDDARSPLRELDASGATSVRGLRIDRAAADAISRVDLVEDIRSYDGRSLLVCFSRTMAVPSRTQAISDHLSALGGDVTVTVLPDELPVPLGEYHYENVGPRRLDTRLELDRRLAGLIADWVVEPSAVGAGT